VPTCCSGAAGERVGDRGPAVSRPSGAQPERPDAPGPGGPERPEPDLARSFGSQAARYDRYRPSYPAEAIEHVLAGLRPRRVLDLGAGTGKLTADLLARADAVVAVEPDAQMRALLTERVPAAEVRSGSAERLDLSDASVDAVFVGQAFHWFARPAADREIARVLRPGGIAGLLWNYPDLEVDWVPELYDATGDRAPAWRQEDDALDEALFTPSTRTWFRSAHRLDGPGALLNLVHTWSWVSTRPAAEQAAIDDRIRALTAVRPQLQGEVVVLPQRTLAVRCLRR
jgi:SAM-dependent methyltransferase